LWEDYDKERNFILHHENNIAEDIAQKLQIANDGLSRGVLTVNDWRIAMGYEKDEKGGDVYLRGFGQVEVPFNSEPIDLPDAEPTEQIELPETTENPQNEGKNEDSGEENPDEKNFERKKKEYRSRFKTLDSDADKERRVKIWKTFDARARSIEEPFKKSMIKAFTKQNELVNEAIKNALDKNKDVKTAIENLYDNKMDEALKHNLAGAFLNGLSVGAEHGQELLNKKGVKEISDNVRRLFSLWVDNHGLELAKEIDDTTKKKLQKVLTESIEEGDSIPEQKKKMIAASDKLFEEDKEWRTSLIARTESCSTMNAGATELYKSEGCQMKEWISVQDDRTRDSHAIMDGVVVPITDKFEVPASDNVEGAYMDYAGDPTAPVGQVANCRCTIAGVTLLE
jgi:SPP1 gp7 family putative phage head morphogenesis protein